MDWMIEMFSGVSPAAEDAVPFVWLDIDEASYRAWREPLYTPRDKLRQLIEFAVRAKPRALVVDVDLSRPGDSPEEADRLREYLAGYSTTCRTRPEARCAPIILTRTFRRQESSEYLQPRRSFLDDAVAGSGHVFWGSPVYERSEDWMIRYWRLWEPACDGRRGIVVPSLQLLTVAMLQDDKPERAAGALSSTLQQRFSPRCGDTSPASQPRRGGDDAALELGDLRLDPKQDRLYRRIFYTLPWQPRQTAGLFLVSIPAHQVTEAAASGKPLSGGLLDGRVVVIGSSFEDSGDLHPTPLGPMPGSLIIVNAIHSLARYGQIQPLPFWAKLLGVVLLIAILSLAFAVFNSFWGMLISGIALIAGLLPVSFLLFRHGIWVDFALPLSAVQLYKMAVEFEERARNQEPESESDQVEGER